jgi:hypothetical protein
LEDFFDTPRVTRSGQGDAPPGTEGAQQFQCVDFCPICRTADVVRATMPPEFRQHWHSWQREMLLAFRSLLDHYIAHVETQDRNVVRVEDIPIQ